MNFNSFEFLVFLPVVIVGYWALPFRLRKYWLLAASYFCYLYWEPLLILPLLFSSAVDYFCSLGMEANRDKPLVMKLLLLTSIVMNLGLLFTFKYADFFGETVNYFCQAAGSDFRIPALNLVLPIGISFYTFQTMSYTIDVYRGEYHAERDPIVFCLYVTYFPQLVAGPIENPGNLLPQLLREQKPRWDDFSAGIRLLLCGFFRKCVVADFCGLYVNNVYNNLESANALAILCAGALFCVQIYCDFAGYSEIAAGAARLMGVRLMRNFNQPYLSLSITELFRRWHISLNKWFRDYVYIPLGGSRKGKARKLLNTLIVFTLCGLWHGARWTYVLWGFYAGVCLCIESAFDLPRRFGPEWDNPLGKLVRRCGVFVLYTFSALLFRAEDLGQFGLILTRLVTQAGFGTAYLEAAFSTLGLTTMTLLQLILCIVAMAKLGTWGDYDLPSARTATGSARRVSAAVYFVLIIALCWLALLATQDAAMFVYFQF